MVAQILTDVWLEGHRCSKEQIQVCIELHKRAGEIPYLTSSLLECTNRPVPVAASRKRKNDREIDNPKPGHSIDFDAFAAFLRVRELVDEDKNALPKDIARRLWYEFKNLCRPYSVLVVAGWIEWDKSKGASFPRASGALLTGYQAIAPRRGNRINAPPLRGQRRPCTPPPPIAKKRRVLDQISSKAVGFITDSLLNRMQPTEERIHSIAISKGHQCTRTQVDYLSDAIRYEDVIQRDTETLSESDFYMLISYVRFRELLSKYFAGKWLNASVLSACEKQLRLEGFAPDLARLREWAKRISDRRSRLSRREQHAQYPVPNRHQDPAAAHGVPVAPLECPRFSALLQACAHARTRT